jgi:hypothetical protein
MFRTSNSKAIYFPVNSLGLQCTGPTLRKWLILVTTIKEKVFIVLQSLVIGISEINILVIK